MEKDLWSSYGGLSFLSEAQLTTRVASVWCSTVDGYMNLKGNCTGGTNVLIIEVWCPWREDSKISTIKSQYGNALCCSWASDKCHNQDMSSATWLAIPEMWSYRWRQRWWCWWRQQWWHWCNRAICRNSLAGFSVDIDPFSDHMSVAVLSFSNPNVRLKTLMCWVRMSWWPTVPANSKLLLVIVSVGLSKLNRQADVVACWTKHRPRHCHLRSKHQFQWVCLV